MYVSASSNFCCLLIESILEMATKYSVRKPEESMC